MSSILYRPDIFEVGNLAEAVGVILTPEDGLEPAERWERETRPMAQMLLDRLGPSADHTVIDYGCGVGRLSKELIAGTGCNVVGVDISCSMRALSHMYCEAESFFSCGRSALASMVRRGYRADMAFAVWVLQHAESPEEDIALIHEALAPDGLFVAVNLQYRSVPTPQGWQKDEADIQALLEHQFAEVEYVDAPAGAMTDEARARSFCGLYRK